MCLTPLGTGRLYDNQLQCNLHLIIFYQKKKNNFIEKKRGRAREKQNISMHFVCENGLKEKQRGLCFLPF